MEEILGSDYATFSLLGGNEESLIRNLTMPHNLQYTHENDDNQKTETMICLDGIFLDY